MKGKRAALVILLFTVLTVYLPAHAFGEEVYLYSQDNIAVYRRHSDQGNYCFWVNDAVFTAEEAERLLGGSNIGLGLIGEMSFILREVGEYQEIGASLVDVNYSSLADGGYGEPCPVIFSYNDGSGGGQITAYAYILPPETETETESETIAETEQRQTGQTEPQDKETEPQTAMTETQETETDGKEGTEYDGPEQTEVSVEEVQVVQPPGGTAGRTERGTEQPETETGSEPETSTRTEELTEYLRTDELAALEAQSEERSAAAAKETNDDTSGGIWDMLMSGPVYFTTVGIGSTGFLFLVFSIVLDVKMLMKYRRRLKELRQQVDAAKIRNRRDQLVKHNSQQLFYID